MGVFFLVFVLLDIFSNNKSLKSIKPFLLFSVMILGIGTCFKILHWKYADMLLLSSVLLITVIYIIHLIMLQVKGFEEYVRTLFIILLGITSLFTIFHWKGKELLNIMNMLIFVLYFGLLIFKHFRKEKQKVIPPPENENNL